MWHIRGLVQQNRKLWCFCLFPLYDSFHINTKSFYEVILCSIRQERHQAPLVWYLFFLDYIKMKPEYAVILAKEIHQVQKMSSEIMWYPLKGTQFLCLPASLSLWLLASENQLLQHPSTVYFFRGIPPDHAYMWFKIGRASCRERV